MPGIIKISKSEYLIMKEYIESNCSIRIDNGKEHLLETRLSDLLVEHGCRTFSDFINLANNQEDEKLRDRVVAAMTTSDTCWFRDPETWNFLRDVVIPDLFRSASLGRKIRIWSVACSTGQEPYSFSMLLDEVALIRDKEKLLDRFEIIASDISSTSLFFAKTGRYDSFMINRGLSEERINRFFEKNGRYWLLNKSTRQRVSFNKLNLQNNFSSLGKFDLILCRNVALYFCENFRTVFFRRIADQLHNEGIFLLGANETCECDSDCFTSDSYYNAPFHRRIAG